MSIKVTTYHIPVFEEAVDKDRKMWFIDRIEGITYKSNTIYNQILLEVSYLLHTPEQQLIEEQLALVKSFEGTKYPILPGDIVRVEIPHKQHGVPADYYLRTETDWEKFNGDVIQLLKHFK